jgi:hypothetical protein
MKNLIFIPLYNGYGVELEKCIKTWKYYAKKHNIDIIVADDNIEFEFEKWGNGIWQRWKDERLIKGDWNKILLVDADTMIRWDAPNVFEENKDKNFCVVRDAGGKETGFYHLNQWTKINQDIKTPAQDYFNCGFLFMNKQNYLKLSSNIDKYYEYWKSFHFMGINDNEEIRRLGKPDAVEQTPINILSWELFADEINYLPDTWNNMVMCKYDDASFINDSYIWHFTGPKLGGWGNKSLIIEQVYNVIKDQYIDLYDTRDDLISDLPKGMKCAELGVFKGDFSKQIFDTMKPSELYLIDIFSGIMGSGDKDGNNFERISLDESYNNLKNYFENNPNVKIIKGFSVPSLSNFSDDYLDFVYVDAGHEYHDVKADLEISYQKVKNGGYICGHDYNRETFPGLCDAVDEFCERYNLKIKYLTKDGCPTYCIIKHII